MRKPSRNVLLALLALPALPASSQVSEPFPAPRNWREQPADLRGSLKPEDLDRLSAPMFTRQTFRSAQGTFLLVTADHGSDLVLRDAYVYAFRHPVWQPIAHVGTNSPKLTSRSSMIGSSSCSNPARWRRPSR